MARNIPAGRALRTRRMPWPHSCSKRASISDTATASGNAPAAIRFPRWGWGRSACMRDSLRARLDPGPLLARQAGVLHGRVARVVVEAHPALAPVPAGGQHLAQDRRAGEALLAELVEHHVADRAERVEADEVAQRERAHGMAGPRLHRLVDLGDRPHALL